MKILKYQAFFENLQEEPQGGQEEAQGEPDFRKIAVPGTNLNLDQFQQRLPQHLYPITEYELSSDGTQVTEINGIPIAQVLRDEFSEGEI